MTQKRCSSLLLHSGLPSPATTSLRIPSSQTVSSPLADPSLLPTKGPCRKCTWYRTRQAKQCSHSPPLPIQLSTQHPTSKLPEFHILCLATVQSMPQSLIYFHPTPISRLSNNCTLSLQALSDQSCLHFSPGPRLTLIPFPINQPRLISPPDPSLPYNIKHQDTTNAKVQSSKCVEPSSHVPSQCPDLPVITHLCEVQFYLPGTTSALIITQSLALLVYHECRSIPRQSRNSYETY